MVTVSLLYRFPLQLVLRSRLSQPWVLSLLSLTRNHSTGQCGVLISCRAMFNSSVKKQIICFQKLYYIKKQLSTFVEICRADRMMWPFHDCHGKNYFFYKGKAETSFISA
jgi:hypothetical protein